MTASTSGTRKAMTKKLHTAVRFEPEYHRFVDLPNT